MMKILLGFLVLMVLESCNTPNAKNASDIAGTQDTLMILRNDSVTLSISRLGGAIVGFHFNNRPLNPLDWKVLPKDMPANNKNGAPFQGHFLCVGRWGAPTSGEMAAGIPHNGEPSNRWWTTDTLTLPGMLQMRVHAPLEQWQVNRTIKLYQNQACFDVEETLTNLLNIGRFTAIVQHSTLGGDFLNERTIINTNASDGFNQALAKKSLTDNQYKWPVGFSDSLGTTIDLTRSDIKDGYVTTHIIEEGMGWATAASPDKHLLIGYVWRTDNYPWLHIWHGIKDGKLWAKGIEFGTTGIGDTHLPAERHTLQFHGRNNNLFVDSKTSITKKYTCFLIRIPEYFKQTTGVVFANCQIKINYQTQRKTIESRCISVL